MTMTCKSMYTCKPVCVTLSYLFACLGFYVSHSRIASATHLHTVRLDLCIVWHGHILLRTSPACLNSQNVPDSQNQPDEPVWTQATLLRLRCNYWGPAGPMLAVVVLYFTVTYVRDRVESCTVSRCLISWCTVAAFALR